MQHDDIERRLNFALDASERAAGFVMTHYLEPGLAVDLKSDESPVTVADRGAEEMLRRELLAEFPQDAVMGEEYGETSGTSGFRWVLDPVDGTKSFVHGVPLFGMLIGLQFAGENVAGICRMPALGEVVFARRGGGCWWQQSDRPARRAQVSPLTTLAQALFCFTAVEGFTQIDRPETLFQLSQATRLSRGWGDCYGHLLVATGRAELMVDPLLAEWDGAALIPIVEEAGGVFMDWSGKATATGGNGISTTPALRQAVLDILSPEQECSG